MDCKEAQQLRHAYLDGEIGPGETPALEAHLRGCAECAALFRGERELSAAIKLEVPRLKAPDLLRARIGRELARREAAGASCACSASAGTRRRSPPRWCWRWSRARR